MSIPKEFYDHLNAWLICTDNNSECKDCKECPLDAAPCTLSGDTSAWEAIFYEDLSNAVKRLELCEKEKERNEKRIKELKEIVEENLFEQRVSHSLLKEITLENLRWRLDDKRHELKEEEKDKQNEDFT